jgi:type II secretory pathway component PulL
VSVGFPTESFLLASIFNLLFFLVMSIKLLAIELYRAQRDVSRLEEQRENFAVDVSPDIVAGLCEELRQAKAEVQQLRKMLDDKKDSPSLSPRPRSH